MANLQSIDGAAQDSAQALAKQAAMDQLQEQVTDKAKTEKFRHDLLMSVINMFP